MVDKTERTMQQETQWQVSQKAHFWCIQLSFRGTHQNHKHDEQHRRPQQRAGKHAMLVKVILREGEAGVLTRVVDACVAERDALG